MVVFFGLIYYRSINYDTIIINHRTYKVIGRYSDKEDAANQLKQINDKGFILLSYLKDTYYNDADPELKLVLDNLLHNYDPDFLRELDPIWALKHRALTSNFRYISMTLRKKNGVFYNEDLLFFVFLHELAHVGTSEKYLTSSDSHVPMFWSVFKFLLTNAVHIGIIQPVDYKKNPTNYVGIPLTHSPFYDSSIHDLV